MHYQRAKKAGLLKPIQKASLADRISERAQRDPVTDCWLWTGSVDATGYARLGARLAHRLSYESFTGPIPAGSQLDHLCRRRHCVNPGHLEPVTARENSLRGFGAPGVRARATKCVAGHPFSDENTWIAKNGTRHCRACNNARQKATKQRRLARLAAAHEAVAAGGQ